MSEAEKENRINSFALGFLERQQIVPNFYADQIVRGYKEGYRQAEKDNELTWKDIMLIHKYIKDAINLHLDEFQSVEGQKKIYTKVLEKFKG